MGAVRNGIRFKVTPDDIARAVRNDSMRCVVARSIARTRPDAHRITVDGITIRFTEDGERLVWSTPYQVAGYVIDFDAGDPIEPFNFMLTERNRLVNMGHRKTTPAGAELARARARARAAKAKAAKATPATARAAKAKATRAAKELKETTAKHAGARQTVKAGSGTRPAPKRANAREYGQRTLRVNRDRFAK